MIDKLKDGCMIDQLKDGCVWDEDKERRSCPSENEFERELVDL